MATVQVETKFYHYSQNNSGGSFVEDPEKGIGTDVIIEALSASDADNRAEAIGLYFDGIGDCSCCGDRWSSQWSEDEGKPYPHIYGKPIEKAQKGYFRSEAFIHRFDGTIEHVEFQEK